MVSTLSPYAQSWKFSVGCVLKAHLIPWCGRLGLAALDFELMLS